MWRLACLVAALLVSGPLRAAECPAPAGSSPQLAHVDPEVRFDFIRAHLLKDGGSVRRWRIAWAVGYAVVLVTELSLIPVLQGNPRRELYVGAGSGALGLTTALLTPLRSRADGLSLEGQPEPGPPAPCDALARAEKLLERDAHDERFEHSVLPHVGNVLFNLGLGLLIGLGFHDWRGAAITMAAGIPIGEAMIWTSPMGAADALARYRSGDLSVPKVQLRVEGPSLAVTF